MKTICPCCLTEYDDHDSPVEYARVNKQNTMNQTKHTPGPWHFTDQLESKGQSVYTVGYTDETGERTHDIRFIPPVSDWHTAHANTRLISAAPELLEACKLVERAFCGDGVQMSLAVDACLMAIKKAGAK